MTSINISHSVISLQQLAAGIKIIGDEGSVQQAAGLKMTLLSISICQ